MRVTEKKGIAVVMLLAAIAVLSGCTNWKLEYEKQLVKNRNLEGQLRSEREHKGQIAEEGQKMIAELQRRIDELKQTPGTASGFGDDYDVRVDPSAGTITVTLQNKILFGAGQATLRKGTSKELDHIQSVLRKEYSGRGIDVVGHTDSTPIKVSGWDDNLELSGQRAFSVARYLVKRGIPPDKVRAVGCGAARPVASNSTAKGKAKNRRVEIVVYMR